MTLRLIRIELVQFSSCKAALRCADFQAPFVVCSVFYLIVPLSTTLHSPTAAFFRRQHLSSFVALTLSLDNFW